MDNLNIKEVVVDDVSVVAPTETLQVSINELIQKVSAGEYQQLSGDLVGYNPTNNKVDIININLNHPSSQNPNGYLGVSRMMFHNQTETNLAHDDLCETMGLAVVEQRGNDNALEGYLVLRGYESFTQEIMLLVPEEQPDEQEK
jgi:hypothetical protein